MAIEIVSANMPQIAMAVFDFPFRVRRSSESVVDSPLRKAVVSLSSERSLSLEIHLLPLATYPHLQLLRKQSNDSK